MDVRDALILGIIQGLTEFLPVSSSGHLTVGQWLLGLPDDVEAKIAFDVTVHVATLLVVIVATGRQVVSLARKQPRLVALTLAGTVPVGLAYLVLGDRIALLKQPAAVGGLWLLMGVLLVVGEPTARACSRRLGGLRPRDALLVGLAQAAALAPGISRSGVTILAGLQCKLDRQAAFTFSFLLYLPVVVGAAAVKARKLGELASSTPWPLAAGFVAAFASGLLAFWLLRRAVLAGRLAWFGLYCLGIGGATLAFVGLSGG